MSEDEIVDVPIHLKSEYIRFTHDEVKAKQSGQPKEISMQNQKDVSLAHLKALLANGCDAVDQDGLTEPVGYPMCAYCEGKADRLHEGTEIIHKSNCVYVAAKDHVARVNEQLRSEAMKNERPAPSRYSEHPGG
jgi:hypothetical protein